MLTMRNAHILQAKDFFHELVFTTSRSSGPGGQNVNKVNSKVTVKFDVLKSSVLSPERSFAESLYTPESEKANKSKQGS